jgi:GTP-binding protein
MAPPVIAIVGAPNVGKSTLFNRLSRRRRALVHRAPGMTRDRLEQQIQIGGRPVELVDTGGILPESAEEMARLITRQSVEAMSRADLILLVVDGRAGLTAADSLLVDAIRKQQRPVIVAVNKLDTPRWTMAAGEFHALGLEPVLAISAEHGTGMEALESHILELLPAGGAEVECDSSEISLALIGRPNVGKSSLLNRLLNEDRVMVSETPGTTRDAIDTVLRAHGWTFCIVDTAGLRRRRAAADDAESLAIMQAKSALKRAQVAALVMDARDGLTAGDRAVAGEALDAGRAVLPVLNKWDLVSGREEATARFRREAAGKLKFIPHAGFLTVSAKTGLRVRRILEEALLCHGELTARRPTRDWNRALRAALEERRAPIVAGKPLRFYYAVQTGAEPPQVAIFVNTSLPVPASYRRFLENRLRSALGLTRVPLRLEFQPRGRPSRGREPR